MNPIIYLSCLVVVIGSLVWTASAEGFESERDRVVGAFKDASPDSIGDSNVYLLANFLDKYADQIQLTGEKRIRVDNAVKQYKEEKQALVDGVPPQGGIFSKLLREILVQLGITLATEGIKKATGN